MKFKAIILLLLFPLGVFSQEDLSASLELKMFNNSEFIVSIDGKQFDACSNFKLNEIKAGEHDLKVFKPKQYVNPIDQSISERLVTVYSGEIFVANNKCTSCVINEYHQKELRIKR